MSATVDFMGRCLRCGKHVSSSAGCNCADPMSTTPQTFRIAEKAPEFPCWLWRSSSSPHWQGVWSRYPYENMQSDYSHWCHSDIRPTHDPRSPAPSDGVPTDTEMIQWIRANCNVVHWPADGAYPIEHNLAAGKDAWALLQAAMRGGNEGK